MKTWWPRRLRCASSTKRSRPRRSHARMSVGSERAAETLILGDGMGRFLAACTLAVCACGGGAPDVKCQTPEGGLSVRYVGQAFGYGTIDVSRSEDEEMLSVNASMVGPD